MPFDINRFVLNAKRQLEELRQRKNGDLEAHMHLQESVKDGIRIILEVKERSDGPGLKDRFLARLRPDFLHEITPLFRGAADEPSRTPHFDLAKFWLLRIFDVSSFVPGGNLFDLAHELRQQLDLHSAEPDLPYEDNEAVEIGSRSRVLTTAIADRAWSLRTMRVPEAWKYSLQNAGLTPQGSGIVIGHPDTGYTVHDDLDAARLLISKGYDFIDNKWDPLDPLTYKGSPGHGTATGSVIMSGGGVTPAPISGGGTTPPGEVTGVAPQAGLIPIRTAKFVAWIFSSHIAQAIHFARQCNCHVISISMGGTPLRALHAAIYDAVADGIVVVAAAGNEVRTVVYPARYPECIALAATNYKDIPWRRSSRGKAIDVSAPGEQVWRAIKRRPTDSNTGVGPSNGTSYAAANAAGVAALWLSHHGADGLRRAAGSSLQETFRMALRTSARVPPAWNASKFGAGIIDAHALLALPVPPTGITSPFTSDLDETASLLEPLDEEVAKAMLAQSIGVPRIQLEQTLGPWLGEIAHIFFTLNVEEDPSFQMLTTHSLSTVDIGASQLRALLERHGSESLLGWLVARKKP
ncbi:MAG: S8 family serine peptidase [Rhodospirillaceae bacterium]